ncbi:YxiG family protein [Fusibacter sp. JL298sf-3]
MSNQFNPVLDAYSRGTVDSVNINMDYDIISVAVQSKDHVEPVEITFEDVRAFYYIDHDMTSKLDISSDALNAIVYDTTGFGEFTAVAQGQDEDHFVAIPNFAVSIKDSSLYIDAQKIRINDKAYRVR